MNKSNKEQWNSSQRGTVPKFRYDGIFAIIVKITVYSENFNFRYDCIFAMIAKFRYHSENQYA